VTLGFGEIVPIVFLNAEKYTQGTNGIGGVDRPNIFGYEFPGIDQTAYYVLMTIVVTIVLILVYRLLDSRIGRAWAAIREDELAAAANGINTVTTKLAAFALGATTAGFAGVLNASKLTIVDPTQFQFQVSFVVLAMIVLGGMGNPFGVAVGAFVLYNIQNVLLKQLNAVTDNLNIPILQDIDFVKFQFLLFGIALVLMMMFRPEGLIPSQRRRQELHSAEADSEADLEALAPDAGEVAL
jgi:ABC-type branched-subunit amino acid transport system permease subunit